MSKLSVCIVTHNEEHNILNCLNSVKWANEIIVVDSFSADNTVSIAKNFATNVKVVSNKWEGCGIQKQFATNLATNEWILILDADEILSFELQKEIKNTLENPLAEGYIIPFKSYYCNKQIRFGDWLGESHLRLFKKASAYVVPRLIHFRIELKGKTKKLKGYIHHYSFPNLEKVLHKVNQYSTDGAVFLHSKGKKCGLLKAIARGTFAFIRGYILKLGFLDGKEGLLLAFSNAQGTFYKYAKLMLLAKKTTK